MIPQKDIEHICCLDKNWNPDNIKIERVGGQTNRNYKVRYKNAISFVRLAWQAADIVDREIEAKNILALASCKKLAFILPKYRLYIFQGKNILEPRKKINFDVPDGTMVMEYIEGKDIDGRDLENPIKIKTYQEIIKKAPLIYGQDFDPDKAYCGALTNILVMFWWGLVRYFNVTTREEKEYFEKYVLDRAKGIRFLFDFIENKKKG